MALPRGQWKRPAGFPYHSVPTDVRKLWGHLTNIHALHVGSKWYTVGIFSSGMGPGGLLKASEWTLTEYDTRKKHNKMTILGQSEQGPLSFAEGVPLIGNAFVGLDSLISFFKGGWNLRTKHANPTKKESAGQLATDTASTVKSNAAAGMWNLFAHGLGGIAGWEVVVALGAGAVMIGAASKLSTGSYTTPISMAVTRAIASQPLVEKASNGGYNAMSRKGDVIGNFTYKSDAKAVADKRGSKK